MKTAKSRSINSRPGKAKPGKADRVVAAGRKAVPDKPARQSGKLATLITLLTRENGATVDEMAKATGWKVNSIRGAMSGSISKKRGLTISSSKNEGARVYRIARRPKG